MRLFVAAYPSPAALDDLERFSDELLIVKARLDGINARVTARPLWHLTLVFLGEIADDRVPEAGRALDRAAEQVRPIRPALRCSGGGRFGRARFTLLWAGFGGDVAALTRVSDAVRKELRASRLPYDQKRFAPHLTIARPGDRLPEATIAADLEALAVYRGPQWILPEIALMASHLGPNPRHELIHRSQLV
jgi:RNA 2',3'-cyclic 3'-phosphodiesterase